MVPLVIFLHLLLMTIRVTASPINSHLEPKDITPQTLHNGNLSYDPSPVGPDDLRTAIRQSHVHLDKEGCLHVAMALVAYQALRHEWDSRLVSQRMTWTGPSGVRIVADSFWMQPMEQRLVVWTVLRMIDYIVRTNSYVVSVAEVNWRGENVGAVAMQIIPPDLSTKTSSGRTIQLPKHSLAEVVVGDDALTFEAVHYEGAPIPVEQVFRSSIAAVNTVAQRYRRSDNIVEFANTWPHSPGSVLHDWRTYERHSRLSKTALLRGIVQAQDYAWMRDDYRGLRGIVRNHGQYIGEGGYSLRRGMDESSL